MDGSGSFFPGGPETVCVCPVGKGADARGWLYQLQVRYGAMDPGAYRRREDRWRGRPVGAPLQTRSGVFVDLVELQSIRWIQANLGNN